MRLRVVHPGPLLAEAHRRDQQTRPEQFQTAKNRRELPHPGDAGSETPSPPLDGGEGRGEEGSCVMVPLASVLSPLLRRRERKQNRAPKKICAACKNSCASFTNFHEGFRRSSNLPGDGADLAAIFPWPQAPDW